jgi:hypothetical protein
MPLSKGCGLMVRLARFIRKTAFWLLFIAIALSAGMAVAEDLPVGTVVPIMLSTGLNADKDKSEKKIEGKVMQDVPLPKSGKIRKGSRITGHVVSVNKGPSGFRLVVKFDTIRNEGRTVRVKAALLALASMGSVADAQAPVSLNSDITPKDQWSTRQVGGDTVSRSVGKVASHDGIIGTWLYGTSVLARLTPNEDAGCPTGPGYDQDQAVWVFSSGACGIYGLKNITIVASGRLPPFGEIAFASKDKIEIRDGSGWLLIAVE